MHCAFRSAASLRQSRISRRVALVVEGNIEHDRRSASVVERYVSIAGRVSALIVGTLAIEMIFQGLEQWLASSRMIGAE